MHVRLSFSDELHVPDAHTVLLVCEVKYHKMFRCSVYDGLRDKAPWVRGWFTWVAVKHRHRGPCSHESQIHSDGPWMGRWAKDRQGLPSGCISERYGAPWAGGAGEVRRCTVCKVDRWICEDHQGLAIWYKQKISFLFLFHIRPVWIDLNSDKGGKKYR